MGGPWFTVSKLGSGWRTVGTLLISDGVRHIPARVDIRIQLEEPSDES